MNEVMQIAKTIIDQIKAGSDEHGNRGLKLMMCWGARDYVAQHPSCEFLGGVNFRVSGRRFKGIVRVMLDGSTDTYTVQLCKVSKGKLVVKQAVEGIYCDSLTMDIDSLVEQVGQMVLV